MELFKIIEYWYANYNTGEIEIFVKEDNKEKFLAEFPEEDQSRIKIVGENQKVILKVAGDWKDAFTFEKLGEITQGYCEVADLNSHLKDGQFVCKHVPTIVNREFECTPFSNLLKLY